MQKKNTPKILFIAFLLFPLITISSEVEGELIFLEAGSNQTEYCQYATAAVFVRSKLGSLQFTQYHWEVENEGEILAQTGNYVFVELTTPGNNTINFSGIDKQGNQHKAQIALTAHEIPTELNITKSRSFFNRIFGKEFPVKLQVDQLPAGNQYQWFKGQNKINDAVKGELKVNSSGTYYLVVTTPQGCELASSPVEF